MKTVIAALALLSGLAHAQINPPGPPRFNGIQFAPVTTGNPIPAAASGLYFDGNLGTLRLHNPNNTFTTLSPGWSQTSGLGTWQMQVQMDGASATQDYLLRYTHGVDATGVVRGPWNFVCTANPESSIDLPSYIDNTCQWGWNAGGGGSYLSGQPSLYLQLEQFFETVGLTHQMEGHLIFNHPISGQWRPWSVEGFLDGSGGVRVFLTGSFIDMGIGQTAGSMTSQFEIASDTTRGFSPNGHAYFQMTDGLAVLAENQRANPASLTLNSSDVQNGQISTVGDISPNANDLYDGGNLNSQVAWRNWYVRRVIGGCNTLANRPGCSAGILTEGAHYSVCSVPGVSNGAEYVCHCASNGACAWQ